MTRTSLSRTLWEYVKHRRGFLFLLALFALLFALSFYLYGLPSEPVEYGVMLCFFTGGVVLVVDVVRYVLRHRRMEALRDAITLSIEELPSPRNLVEQDYTELVNALYEDKTKTVSYYDNLHSDMTDYYSLWAHQIKTPIAAMHLLLDTTDVPHAAELSGELFKIEQYVEMVLSYLRLDANSSDLCLRLYQLDDIVRQGVRKYASQFIRKKIRLEYQAMDCFVLTDEKWLLFAMEQVLSNALKYTPAGGQVTISLEPNSKVLRIADNGIGIAPEDLPRVCEKGFTGYNGRTDKKSTGIGLYLCKRILTMLSHTITVESQAGQGTVVRIGLETVDFSAE